MTPRSSAASASAAGRALVFAFALVVLSPASFDVVVASSSAGTPPASAGADDGQQSSEQPSSSSTSSWHRFGSNVNYRITAILDVNGGADAGPDFDSFSDDGSSTDNNNNKPKFLTDDESSRTTTTTTTTKKTPGYGIPIDVLTLRDPSTGRWRQRVSYHGGTQVDYNDDGMGYKVVPRPFEGDDDDDDDDGSSSSSGDASKKKKESGRTCFFTGGNATIAKEKVAYLNFFPTAEQMKHYTLGELVTTEPGMPYRVASLEAHHGEHDAVPSPSQPDASYDSNAGMPSEDWFQFRYEEGAGAAARPLRWTMLARNQIINAHTEDWVMRYLSYDAIDDEDERKMWEGWFDSKFAGDCGDDDDEDDYDRFALVEGDGGDKLRLNRLGMFFSSSSPPAADGEGDALPPASGSSSSSRFDSFLLRHNRDYRGGEYSERRAIHDANEENVRRWNEEHAGRTSFAPNEFMDMDAREVMMIRGGHVPARRRRRRKEDGDPVPRENNEIDPEGRPGNDQRNNLRQTASSVVLVEDHADGDDGSSNDGDDGDEYVFAKYQVPKDFDPSTLPEEFDWREHLPGSVPPVKDQGFCGSCWAFSFVSALESHWFIEHGQSVNLPEQFVNDCAWSDEGAHACDGGDAGHAAKDIVARFGGRVPSRDAYGGYLSIDGACYVDILRDAGLLDGGGGELTAASSAVVRLTDWAVLPSRDDVATKHAMFLKGPLSVALNVVDELLYYASGVLDVASCEKNDGHNLDHAVNLLGWGTDEMPDGSKAEHWILRNSWSDLWGDSGYFKVRMGERDCGVTTRPGFPVIPRADAGHGLARAPEMVSIS